MFKTLFLATLFITLLVNIIFLFATKDKPPDPSTTTFVSSIRQSQDETSSSQKRLFLRSNDLYDYSSSGNLNEPITSSRTNTEISGTNYERPRYVERGLASPSGGGGQTNADRSAAKSASPAGRDRRPTEAPTNLVHDGTTLANNGIRSDDYFYLQQLLKPSSRFSKRDDKLGRFGAPAKQSGHKSRSVPEMLAKDAAGADSPVTVSIESEISHAKRSQQQAREIANNYEDGERKHENKYAVMRGKIGKAYYNINNINKEPEKGDTNKQTESSDRSLSRQVVLQQDEKKMNDGDNNNLPSRNPLITSTTNGTSERLHRDRTTSEGDDDYDDAENDRAKQDREVYDSRWLDIKVKSSRSHVFVSVDGIIIYESKSKPLSLGHQISGGAFQVPSSSSSIARQQAQTSGRISDDADSTEGRGIHVIVLNQHDGYIMSKRVFDTYSTGQDDELCFFLNMVRDGRILIFAIKDEGSFKMLPNSPARALLQRFGSQHISKLRWRDMWAFVARKVTPSETNLRLGESAHQRFEKAAKRMNLSETLTKSSRFSDWAPPAILRTQIELADRTIEDDASKGCSWRSGSSPEDRRRLKFCSRIEGYGSVCDCDSPAPISFAPTRIVNSQLDQIPIIVMASNRPYYLYRMLRSLLAADGVNRSLVTVFIDGYYEEPLEVSQLFNLRAIQQRPLSQRSARISNHYKTSLTATFELFPSAEFAIIFEEDLDVAQDALIYFNQTLDLLRTDPSLYCVSAWNDQGYEHTVGDSGLLYRIETMPGLGWMLSRRLYKEELEPNWPSADQPHDWDMWIRTQSVRKNRECIIPDISRTFHFGSTGTNINSYFQKQYFSKHAFNLVPQSKFAHLDQMRADLYEKLVQTLLLEALPVDTLFARNNSLTNNPRLANNATALDRLCSLVNVGRLNQSATITPLPLRAAQQQPHTDGRTNHSQQEAHYVIFIEMIDGHDFGNWLKLAKCWRIWDLDVRGQHNSMWRLFLSRRPFLVVGVPASPYSRYKPKNLVPFKLD